MTEEMLHDKMAQMIRVGIVNARQPEKMRVKVTIPDTTTSPLVTDWLPVLCPRASQDMQYDLPDVGDQVLCLFLAYGLEQGFVVGAMYGKQQPPVQNGDKWHRKFSDGAVLEYDRKSHSLLADIPGTAKIKCKDSITLEAPIIYLRGTLTNTAMDGGPGESVFSGGMTVQNGGVNVTDADVNANGVSLTDHSHEGVQAGNDTSSHPVGGGTGKGTEKIPLPNIAQFNPQHFAALEVDVKNYAELGYPYSDVYKVIMCLPKITEAEAKSADVKAIDKPGLKLLHIFFNIWLSGIANADPKDNPIPFIIKDDKDIFGEFDNIYKWAMQFDRFKQVWDTIPSKAINEAAKLVLVERLKENNYLTDKLVHFDFTKGTWRDWNNKYYQYITIESPPLSELYNKGFDGLFSAFGSFTIRLLPKGFVEPLKNGGHRIHLTEIAAYIYDGFNFEGDELLGCWDCESKSFTGKDCIKGTLLSNNIFNHFREEFGKGNDFMTFSEPKLVDGFKGIIYDTSL